MPKPKPRIKKKTVVLTKGRIPSGDMAKGTVGGTDGPTALPSALEREIERQKEIKKAKRLERERHLEEEDDDDENEGDKDEDYDDYEDERGYEGRPEDYDYDGNFEDYEYEYDEDPLYADDGIDNLSELDGSDAGTGFALGGAADTSSSTAVERAANSKYKTYISRKDLENYLFSKDIKDIKDLKLTHDFSGAFSENDNDEYHDIDSDQFSSEEPCLYHKWDNILCGNCVIGTKLLLEIEKEPYILFLTADEPAKIRVDDAFFGYTSKIKPKIKLYMGDTSGGLFLLQDKHVDARFLYIPHETDIIAILKSSEDYDLARLAKFAQTTDGHMWHIITVPKSLTKNTSHFCHLHNMQKKLRETLLKRRLLAGDRDIINGSEHFMMHYLSHEDQFSPYKDLVQRAGTSISSVLG